MDAKIYQHLSDLSEPTRTRLLLILGFEPTGISVGELTRIMQLPQSTVSRHLKVLKNGGWLQGRSEGPANYFWLDCEAIPPEANALWQVIHGQMMVSATHLEELERAKSIVANRHQGSRSFFGRVGAQWDQVRNELFGNNHQMPALLSLFEANFKIADIGCGTGDNLKSLAEVCSTVIGVDQEASMLAVAKARTQGIHNVELRQGDIGNLPIKDQEVRGCICSLVLHHMPDAAQVFREVFRVLQPGGRFVLVDMTPHQRLDYGHTMGHHHLGFSQEDISQWALSAGFEKPKHRRLDHDPEVQGPALFLSVMMRS